MRNKYCHLKDFVTDNSIDIFCTSETWLYDNDSAIVTALTPEYHVVHNVHRPDNNGGVVGCLINKSLQSKKQQTKCFKSFEFMDVQLSSERQKIIMNIFFRPPHGNFSFFQKIESLFLESETKRS